MGLNSKQLRFVREYLADRNATRAAMAAGYGSTEKSASTLGSRLLGKVEVAAEIKKADDAEAARLARKAARKGLTKERWLEELRQVALANMDDFITIEEIRVHNGRLGKKIKVLSAIPVKTANRRRSLGRAIKKISETKNGIGIELHNKLGALETLGKAYGWIKDAVDLNIPDGVNVNLTMPSNGREAPPEGGGGESK